LFSGFGANLICHFGAFAYPCYATLLILNSKEKGPSSQFWLVYWIVYAFLGVSETVFDVLLRLIPLYYPVKLVFIFWLYLPQTRGADLVYRKLVLPVFKQNESKIDEALKNIDKNIVNLKK
jgi:receptor expression-enhancing protein 5/6